MTHFLCNYGSVFKILEIDITLRVQQCVKLSSSMPNKINMVDLKSKWTSDPHTVQLENFTFVLAEKCTV